MILSRTIGIDLGTTNSAVALLAANERDLVLAQDDKGRVTTPSCVWADPKNGEIVVGHRAYARRGTRPEPIASIKRSMGTQVQVALGGVPRTPAEVSAFILKELKRQIETQLAGDGSGVRHDIRRAIITVPAYFGLPAIEATREAGQLADLEVAELLHEPTAAAIYYSWKHNLGDGYYMVYDLGGGTFDVSILQRISGEFRVLGIAGDNFLGGDDIDRRLAERLRQLLAAEGYELELDVTSDPEDQLRLNQLVTLAERAKKQLSDHQEIVLRDQGTLRDRSGAAVVVDLTLSRAGFEDLIGDLLDRTLVACQTALARASEKAGVTLADIDHILLVGGSTYVPAVLEKVRAAFCAEGAPARAKAQAPIRDEPETAVALGAALRAAASGIGVGDDEGRVRIWFRGTAATRREQATISGQVEALAPDLALEGGRLRLVAAAGATVGEVELGAGLRFAFRSVELLAESFNEFRFEVLDASGALVATITRGIAHSADQKEAVGRTLSTAVLSKPIVLEATDGDRRVRQVLLPEGAPLPATARFGFSIADATGHVRLPIYQESRIIKELHGDIGPTPVGTPVDIEITCDEQVHIQVKYWVGEQEFGGHIEPPPPDVVPTEFEIEQIDGAFARVLRELDEHEASPLTRSYEQAHRDLLEARAGGDFPKVIQRAADLKGLVHAAEDRLPLKPALEALETQLRSCLSLLPEAAKVNPKLVPGSLAADLEGVGTRMRAAYAARDRHAYADSAHAVTAALEFLSAVTQAKGADDEKADVSVRAVMALQRARGMLQYLLLACLVGRKPQFIGDVSGYLEETGQLETRVAADPAEVLNRCQVLMTEARRIYLQVNPEDKTHGELDGLIKVGPGGAGGAPPALGNLFGSGR